MPFLALFFALGPIWQHASAAHWQESFPRLHVNRLPCSLTTDMVTTTQKTIENWLRKYALYEAAYEGCPDIRLKRI